MEWAPARGAQPCPEYGSWRGAPEAVHGGGSAPPPPHAAHAPPQEAELAELAGRALRVLLGSDAVLLHPQLRLAVLGRAESDSTSSSRSKCLLELAVAWLVEQGLVVRQGYGPLASLAVPDLALPRAEALAYSDFPDERHAPSLQGGAAALRPAYCLNRMRRHSSPRQFGGRMSGIEKAPARRSKRSVGEEMSSQMSKKLRVHGGGAAPPPLSPSSRVAMSP